MVTLLYEIKSEAQVSKNTSMLQPEVKLISKQLNYTRFLTIRALITKQSRDSSPPTNRNKRILKAK